jgi:hypothetical protein
MAASLQRQLPTVARRRDPQRRRGQQTPDTVRTLVSHAKRAVPLLRVQGNSQQ